MKKRKIVYITKASGETTPFNEDKLRKSLIRAGASNRQISQILKEISGQLYEGIATKKIYRLAFNKLKNNSKHLAARYHLKTAIMELGPSGFAFEKFVAALLFQQGYAVKVGEIVQGKCVTHEIDVIAEKDNHHFMIECKYHNLRGTVSDVKIPLYIDARFKDVAAVWINMPEYSNKFHQGWVVTNTRFTGDAILYGNCAGLKLLSWDYPAKESLKELIDDLGLYPITCLTTLTRIEKQKLLEKEIVLCKDLRNNEKLLYDIGMKDIRVKNVLSEGYQLCNKLRSNGNH